MPINLKWLLKLPAGRLSRRIGLWVFISVIVIETIIFIPSFHNRKNELLDQIREISTAKIAVLMKLDADLIPNEELMRRLKHLEMDPHILGGAIYNASGEMIDRFGEQPHLTPTQIIGNGITNLASKDGTRYDSAWNSETLQDDFTLILRQDATSVKSELIGYILRIVGLVVIISIFVTVGALVALEPIIITPILKLRGDLIKAGESVQKDLKPPNFYTSSIARKDELGEVILAFVKMYNQIIDAISKKNRAERSLQESLRQVESYSKALNKELEQGRHMQANFLPDRLPNVKGWEFAAFFKPARQVSGDFYDIFKLPSGQIGIVIADICDKGVGAALFMALFRSLIRIFSGQTELKGLRLSGDKSLPDHDWPLVQRDYEESDQVSALEAVRMTNNYIIQNHEDLGMFATLFFGVLNPDTGMLSYVSGGHDPLFLIDSSGRATILPPTGPAVGLRLDATFHIEQAHLEPGTTMLGCTDGVTEARSLKGNLFSRNRLEMLVSENCASASDLVEHIKTNLFSFIGNAAQEDDITLLAVRHSQDRIEK